MQHADRVRYGVTILRPSGVSLSNLKLAVTLPPSAEVMDTLQTSGRTVFLGMTAAAQQSWSFNATPTAITAAATEADVTLSGAATTGDFVTAGETGVQLQVLDGSVPDGTVLQRGRGRHLPQKSVHHFPNVPTTTAQTAYESFLVALNR
jgi:hypothetical protein